jgi:hypothetical protein
VEKMLTEKEYNEFRKITFEDIEKNNILLKEEIKNLLEYLKKEKSIFIITKERNINAIKLAFAIINKAYNENNRVYELNETALSNISAPMTLHESPKVAEALKLFTIPFTVDFDYSKELELNFLKRLICYKRNEKAKHKNIIVCGYGKVEKLKDEIKDVKNYIILIDLDREKNKIIESEGY